VTAGFSWFDSENDEGICLYQWYRADDGAGTNLQAISNATHETYTLTQADVGKYLRYEIIPVATSGRLEGNPFITDFVLVGM
jgi:5'-nucleotidase